MVNPHSSGILRAGIICVGAKLSFLDVVAIGSQSVPIVAVCVGATMAATLAYSRLFQLPPRLGSLLAAGTSICGVTAITAVAPAIGATQAEVSVRQM